MATPLTIDVIRSPAETITLAAAGEIDLSNVDAFSRAVTAATAEAARSGARLIADLAAVEYLDSAAISVLSVRADQIDTVVVHPLLHSVFVISGLGELMTVEAATAD
ncbi:STAS domain-containing protein [Mycobacterium sp. smrl_JER01]|uniref:STAS domain-containing protein n=1 Tax=Mycobacterium sp. smrl_JER01 TaxID=3402633 RepID=UPI003AD528AB